jgi:iron complex outermembrane recepter protein
MSRLSRCGCALACVLGSTTPGLAQSLQIPEIEVGGQPSDLTTPPVKERYQLPNTSASTTATQIETTTNAVDAADTIKYLPSLLVRKRNYGDNQEVLGTRYWGINGSARSLVYADDILLTPLIGNNNTNATPRWGMVAPEQIARVDMLYGPFAAMYPGNSMGGVLLFTTKMPDKPVATVRQSESFQTFDFYNTKNTYRTDNTSASFGNRVNNFSFFFGANYLNSYSQPLSWVTTAGAVPAGTTGVILQPNRTNTGPANVLGASGLLHTEQTNLNLKAALDITPWLRATYGLGLWSNDQDSSAQTYLKDAAGNPTYGGPSAGSGFASGTYNLKQLDLGQSLSLKTDTGGAFDWDLNVTRFDYLQDIQRSPFTVTATGTGFTNTGRIARLDGTNWTTADAKGIWRTAGPAGPHEVSFGAHFDYNVLNNPTYQTPTWYGGPDSTNALYSRGDGKTSTFALWAQDAWRFAPQFKLTTGLRWETWRAFDGYNLNAPTNSTTGAITGPPSVVNQSVETADRFSPKASLAWEPNKDWTVTGSFGVANRFPTVGELYQVITAGPILANPNPNLQPEQAYDEEIAIERKFTDGLVRLSLFQDDTYDALIAQTSFSSVTNTTTSFTVNVDHIRNRGIELAWQKRNLPVEKVEMFGSVTYVDSVIISDPTFVGTNGSTAVGKQVPYVPKWRATLGATWRPTDALALTVVGRYQSKVYATLDNTDYVQNVYQSFDPFFVVDARVEYKVLDNGTISFGVDNLNNDKYHLFHPFPQRTFVMQGRLTF